MTDTLDTPGASRFTECRICRTPGEWVTSPGGAWWAHLDHPEDSHDFDPILHYADDRIPATAGWWADVQSHDRDALIQILWRSAMPGCEPITPEHDDWPLYIRRAECIIEHPFIEHPFTEGPRM